MIIKTMTINNYEESYKLWSNTEGMGLRTLDDSKEGILTFLIRNPNTNYICKINNEIVATILCGHDGRRGYIYHTVVNPKYRRKVIGKQLVNKVISSLKKEGINKVSLVVYATNDKGNAFWEKIGFTQRDDLIYRNFSINKTNV